jgi:hypothetical protein
LTQIFLLDARLHTFLIKWIQYLNAVKNRKSFNFKNYRNEINCFLKNLENKKSYGAQCSASDNFCDNKIGLACLDGLCSLV